MKKINEKRLEVLSVALECLKIAQVLLNKHDLEVQNIQHSGAIKQLEPGESIVMIKPRLIDGIVYVVSHLKKPFEKTNLPEYLEELRKENIEFALDNILENLEKIKKSEKTNISELTDYTRVLFHIEREMS